MRSRAIRYLECSHPSWSAGRSRLLPSSCSSAGGLQAQLFPAPGKVPLYLEGGEAEMASDSNVGVEIAAGGARIAYVPGAAGVTPAMMERFARVDVLFFDGTLFRDEEMITTGTGTKTGRRMGHMPIDGEGGSLAALALHRRAAHFRAYQQHQPHSGGRVRRSGFAWSAAAGKLPRMGWRSCCDRACRRTISKPRCAISVRAAIIVCIRFTSCCMAGKCSKGQVQAWALNRYYYQAMIPVKDASLIARCDDAALRREWRSRLVDHDGHPNAMEASRAGSSSPRRSVSTAPTSCPWRGCCRQRAMRSMPTFISCANDRCSRLSPPRSPSCFRRRSSANASKACCEATISSTPRHLCISASALPLARRDSEFALNYVKREARSEHAQQCVLKALEFKCDVLWAMLDALYHAYVMPKHVPHGAFVPKE